MFCAGAIKLYVSKEYDNAIPWLERAANAGHMRAPLVLGMLYEQGSGVKEDPTKQVAEEACASLVFARSRRRFVVSP
jgi:TPR repeat protein